MKSKKVEINEYLMHIEQNDAGKFQNSFVTAMLASHIVNPFSK